MPLSESPNPFEITKAVDLDDAQIEALWVAMAGEGEVVAEMDHPASPMPTFILGAKGSGKTHLLRHQAFELQKLRYAREGRDLRHGIQEDGYIGLYVRCSGLQSSRFAEKRQTKELWNELFSYYFELWLAQHVLYVARDLTIGQDDGSEADFVVDILSLFDKPPALEAPTIDNVIDALTQEQRHLDFEINNILLKKTFNVAIIATRGKLIFGIPRLLAGRYGFLGKVLFSYDIDEFENLTADQQVHVNTLLREKEPPTTFRIGARTYGIRTNHLTNSGGEENLRDSEFKEIPLDTLSRENVPQYAKFARNLIAKRLMPGSNATPDDVLEGFFAKIDLSADSREWLGVVGNKSMERPHFRRLITVARGSGVDDETIMQAVTLLGDPDRPLHEKLVILFVYQGLARGRRFGEAVEGALKRRAANDDAYREAMKHYGDDLAAQLLLENNRPVIYAGVSTFITMSAGIPRALLTVLRSVFDWAAFRDERPFEGGTISLESQRKGVLEASNWYFNSMRKAGEDGALVQAAIERLANVFRLNRFGDKPIESSLCAFSVSEEDASKEALRVLKLAESRAFLHRVPGGQKHRNSARVQGKFQLSPMLAPRWELPIARRGAMPLSVDDFNSIFAPRDAQEFAVVEKKHRARVQSPFKGHLEADDSQLGLFV